MARFPRLPHRPDPRRPAGPQVTAAPAAHPPERAGHPVASGLRQARYDAGETSTGTGACLVVRTGLDVLARTRLFPRHRARNSQPEQARNPCSARWGWVAGVPARRFVQSAGGMSDSRLEPLVQSEAERRTLENWAKRRKTAQGLALRARIVLACADGGPNLAVAARLGVSRGTVTRWRGPLPGPPAGRAGR